MPVVKAAFPLSGATTSRRCSPRSACRRRALARADYTLDEFIDEVVRADAELLARRRSTSGGAHYTVGGCMAELLRAADRPGATRTIAVESEDAARVVAAVRDARAGRAPQRELPRGLRRSRVRRAALRRHRRGHQLGEVPRRRARGGRRVADGRRPRRGDAPRRGARRDRAARPRAPIARTRRRDRGHGRGGAARTAPGDRRGRHGRACGSRPTATELVDAVRERTGVEVEVISGEEEARLAYLGATVGARRRAAGRSSCSTPAAAARSSPSATASRVDERFSVERRRRARSPSASGSTAWSTRRRCAALDAIAADLRASTAARRRTRWSAWAAR